MAKVKQDKAKGARLSPSRDSEIQIPLALVTDPAAPRPAPVTARPTRKEPRLALVNARSTAEAPSRAAPGARSRRAGSAATRTETSARGVATKAKAARPNAKPRSTTAEDARRSRPASTTATAGSSGKASPRVRSAGTGKSVGGRKPGRTGSAKQPVRVSRPAPKPVSKSRPAQPLRKGSPKGAAKKGGPKVGKHLEQRKPERVVLVKELDPFARCGPRTSVEHLIRVEERLDGESSVHLVFFDRHGWYCEHGKACRAVDDVRRHGKQLGLTF